MYRYGVTEKPHLGRPVGTQLTTDPLGVGQASEAAVWVDSLRFAALIARGVVAETTDGIVSSRLPADETGPEHAEPMRRRLTREPKE